MKKKVYILMVAKQFFGDHPRKGEPTYFKEKILKSEKITTIRSGAHWEKVVEEVNAGLAVLSLREWSGVPYRSKQRKICQFTEGLGYQKFDIKDSAMLIEGKHCDSIVIREVALNDGLTYNDFISWFKYPSDFDGGIIHFSKFKY